jgi:predicted ATPase/DNA-binding CsgD family transcriptional regulator
MTSPPSAYLPTKQLPGSLSPFVGRRADLEMVSNLFQDPSVRLVTILGAGGVGKTRFALELAGMLQGQFQHGAIFVPLAQLSTGDEVLPALAGALEIQSPPGSDLRQTVLDHLSNRQVLVVLDNFEHLLEEAVLVRDLLVAGPQVKVLVTSREKLALESESLYHLHGLELPPPDGPQKVEDFDAIRLFLQKARQASPSFSLNEENTPAVTHICRLVDGVPLGILLAAAWVEHFSPIEIADQISSNLDFLTSEIQDTPPRHSSMRAVFDSSYNRLDEKQKLVLQRLSVFRGGFKLAAAKAVAGADLQVLITLVEKSLLSRDPDTGRYDLHELLRQYAREELEAAGESKKLLAAHTAYYLAFIDEREAELVSPSQTKALDEIQADFENIRQAFLTGVGRRDFNAIRTILPGIYKFCDMRSRAYEAEALFRLARDRLAPQSGETPQPAWALALLCWYDMRAYGEPLKTFEEITAWAQSCLKQAESIQDPQAMAASLVLMGAIAEDSNDFKAAIRQYEEAMRVYPLLDDVYWVNMRIGLCHLSAGQYPEAIRAFQVSFQRGKETGERLKKGWALVNIGDTLLYQAAPQEAKHKLEQAYTLFEEIGNKFGRMWVNVSLSKVSIELGDITSAREFAEIAGTIARQLHSVTWIGKVEALLQELEPETSPPLKSTKLPDGEVLSPRELEILQLLKSALSGPEIADRLIVSLNTIRFHTKNIYQKLGVNSRLEAIRRAKELGL